jgi:hypothetical protein
MRRELRSPGLDLKDIVKMTVFLVGDPSQGRPVAYLNRFPDYHDTGDAGFVDGDGYLPVRKRGVEYGMISIRTGGWARSGSGIGNR